MLVSDPYATEDYNGDGGMNGIVLIVISGVGYQSQTPIVHSTGEARVAPHEGESWIGRGQITFICEGAQTEVSEE